ncbi:hypothetical protein OAO39_02880 [Pirellulaceae bacterium]|nr:hypothetical protein [Pirellulaceae bacterium]
MKQQIKIYESPRDITPSVAFKEDAFRLQKKGWYVHTMTAYRTETSGNRPRAEIVAVYRKD